VVHPPKTLLIGRCSRCGRRLYLYDDKYWCKRHNYVFCEACAKKLQYKCPDAVTPLERI
jgi:hypothetical protein